MGYSSYAQNGACALPSPLPFHYLIAKIVPAMQLASAEEFYYSFYYNGGLGNKLARVPRLGFADPKYYKEIALIH